MLKRIGYAATRAVHGNRRNKQGYLVVAKYYLFDDQEWQLGESYLGLLGFLLFAGSGVILLQLYGRCEGQAGIDLHCSASFSSWDSTPTAVKWIFPIGLAGHFIGMASSIRLFLVGKAVLAQPLSDWD